MDLYSIIRELRDERDRVARLIATFEELRQTGSLPTPAKRGRRAMSAEERRQVSARMKEYWASKKTKVAQQGE
jgi:hypothetical protein